MTNGNEETERDERGLELEPEKVRDLDVDELDGNDVHGGNCCWTHPSVHWAPPR